MKSSLKKLILITALITLGVTLVLAVSVFGIVSFCAPKAMMEFTASLGMESISGDYAYEEFLHSGDLDCLARSFLIAAEHGENVKANERFGKLYAAEGFGEYCAQQSVGGEDVPAYDFRNYVMGQAARVKYRCAQTDEARAETVAFALSETDKSFPAGNPLSMLAVEAAERGDAATCAALLSELRSGGFTENKEYASIVRILENFGNREGM